MRPERVIAETIRRARRGTRLTAPEPRRNTSGTPLLPINSPPVKLAITIPVRSSGGTVCATDWPADGPPRTALPSHPGRSGSVNRSSMERPHPECKGGPPPPAILLPENQDGTFLVSRNQSVACLAIVSTSLVDTINTNNRTLALSRQCSRPPIVRIFTFFSPVRRVDPPATLVYLLPAGSASRSRLPARRRGRAGARRGRRGGGPRSGCPPEAPRG
jgi:hypothetical protein